MSSINIVSFPNHDGLLLKGMLHEPTGGRARGICVLLLSPGIKGRVGPHRLYLKIAERLAGRGFHVLRFDFHGLGDSEGDVDEELLSDVYNSIQGGRYMADTTAAMDWMNKNYGVCRFVGSGLCGGSITALLVAAHDQRVESMLALSIPTALDGGEANWARFATSRQLVGIRRNYLKRLLQLKSWGRFLTGKTNYYVLWRSLRQLLPGGDTRGAVHAIRDADQAVVPADDTNPEFAPAFLRFVRSRRPMLLFFSGRDRVRWEFEEKFELRHRSQLEPFRQYFEVRVIADANHILSDPAWVRELLDVAGEWLDRQHGSIT